MVNRRVGMSRLGCLVTLLLVAALGYFGVNVGEVYYRYFLFEDAMEHTVRFADRHSDEAIRRILRETAAELGLPEAAQTINVRRAGRSITVSAEYIELIELPLYVREVHLNPSAEAEL